MKSYIIAAALLGAVSVPALADEVGVHVGPGGVGATVGESHETRPVERDRTTVIKEREPTTDSKTVIKKEDEFGNREKTVIHHDKD